ncbi:MAG: M48 family metalloprotease [Siphonobacter aquaeclarae]|nr:M48 family metalloprotease [Siphonobacter aquaeclarae]
MNLLFRTGLALGLWTLALSAWAQGEERFSTWTFGTQKTQRGGPCDVYMFKSNDHAEKVVDNILRSAGMGFGKRNFQVVECPRTDNCYATIINGVRYIVYDNSFLKLVEDRTHTDWAAISIMAHEIGHHILGHTSDGMGSRPDKELQADYFSGFVVHNLGGSLEEAQIAIRVLQGEEGDASHPPRRDRLATIEKGWREADSFYPRLVKNSSSPTPPPAPEIVKNEPKPEPPKTETRTGCIDGNCDDGEGVYINRKTLERYEGEWQESRPHGFGIQFYANGKKKYEGEFANGKFDGNGTLWLSNGNIYTGDFKTGTVHGKGVLLYANGDRYMGEFRNGQRHGQGKYVYAGGRQEVVYYVNDARRKAE